VRHRFDSIVASLRTRNYRLFFLGQLASLMGVWMQVAAQDWLVLQLSGNSATALGLVSALQFAPVMLLILVGGSLADRYDKRILLALANIVWLVLACGMGVLVVSHLATLGQVYVFAAALGVVTAIESPVRQSFASELVGPRLLPNALSLSASAFNLARVVGPAVGGVAIAVLGTGPVFLVNGLSYLAPVLGLWLMRPDELHRPRPEDRANQPKQRVTDGLRYVWHRPDLQLPVVLVLLVGLLGFNFQLTLPLLAKIVFGTGPAQFGLLTTALAGGALFGALAGAQRRARPSAELLLGAGAAFAVLETATGFAPTFASMAILLVPTGFFMVFFAQAANQRLQLGTEASVRGRVLALYMLVFFGTTPIGSLLVGWLAEHFGARTGVWIGGVGSLLAVAAAFAVRCWLLDLRVQIQLVPRPRVSLVPARHPAHRPGLTGAYPH
jgi:MFS family permease